MIVFKENWFPEALMMYAHMQQLSNRYFVCDSLCLAVKLQEFGCVKLGILKNKGRFCNTIASVAFVHTSIQSD